MNILTELISELKINENSTDKALGTLKAIIKSLSDTKDKDGLEMLKMAKGINDYYNKEKSFAPEQAKWIYNTSKSMFKYENKINLLEELLNESKESDYTYSTEKEFDIRQGKYANVSKKKYKGWKVDEYNEIPFEDWMDKVKKDLKVNRTSLTSISQHKNDDKDIHVTWGPTKKYKDFESIRIFSEIDIDKTIKIFNFDNDSLINAYNYIKKLQKKYK